MKKESVNEYIGYVYKITNKINGKIYIGETLNTIEKRFKQHCSDAYLKTYENYYFYKAIRKYGPENFEISQLEHVSNLDRKVLKEEILKLEKEYIKKYDSFNSGYNSNSGGRHPLEVKKETRELQSKRKKEDPKTIDRLHYARSFQKINKEVIAYNYNTGDKIKEFKSIREASEYYNIDSSGIVKVCKKITNYLGSDKDVKITWRYAEDIYEINYTIKVYDECGNLLNKFITFADAARFYNIKCQETIARCCQGKTKCTGRKKGKKLIWRFINDNFKL